MAADFTSSPPASGKGRVGGRKWKEMPGQNCSVFLKRQHIQNHQWRPFLLGGKINSVTDPFAFSSVWCYTGHFWSYRSWPKLVAFLSCPLLSSLSCGKVKSRCVCTVKGLFTGCHNTGGHQDWRVYLFCMKAFPRTGGSSDANRRQCILFYLLKVLNSTIEYKKYLIGPNRIYVDCIGVHLPTNNSITQ